MLRPRDHVCVAVCMHVRVGVGGITGGTTCEESGRQVGGQTDAAGGSAVDRRRDERCESGGWSACICLCV